MVTRTRRGLPAVASAVSNGGGNKVGRPKGSKDKKPRKTRSDKGKKRGHYKKRSSGEVRA